MAIVGTTLPTLVDVAKRMDPDGSVADVAELLNQVNEVIPDVVWKEGNLPTGHRVSVRTGIPHGTWRLLNAGVPNVKSTTAQIDEQAAILENRSQIDKDIAELNGNTAAFRLSESLPIIEGMGQDFVSTLFYGSSSTTPEQFTGLSARFSSLSAANAQNIVDAGGTGTDNTSIWLVGWSEKSVFGIYPKGSKAGLSHADLGLNDAFDSSNQRFRAYMDWYQWKCGIALKDWRYVARGCNIDVSNLVSGTSAADLFALLTKLSIRVKDLTTAKFAFYMNRTVREYLDLQAQANVKAGGQLSYAVIDGKPIASFRGIPIRTVDQLTLAEARVV